MTRRRRRRHVAIPGEHVLHTYPDGRRFVFYTAQCDCGWIREGHHSRGEAKRAWEGHVAEHTLTSRTFGVDARRRPLR